MHAVFVTARIDDMERARQELHDRVVPAVAQEPGLVAGYWARDEGEGRGMIIFDSEDAARGAAERIRERVGENPGVTLNSVTVGEVVANA